MNHKFECTSVEPRWFWLSYTQAGVFVCAVILQAEDFLDACARSRMAGLAPGGVKDGIAVMGWPLDEEWVESKQVKRWTGKRISKRRAVKMLGAVEVGSSQ